MGLGRCEIKDSKRKRRKMSKERGRENVEGRERKKRK